MFLPVIPPHRTTPPSYLQCQTVGNVVCVEENGMEGGMKVNLRLQSQYICAGP